ncbi:MAG: ATP-binding protein, partial [Trebonia sp.]
MTVPAGPGGLGTRQRRCPLPAAVSGFVGRGDELDRLAGLLGAGRLVTVAGPGGVGKTRLALRAAADATHASGCCLVELSALSDTDLLADAVARCLGLRLSGPRFPGLRRAGSAGRLDALPGELLGKLRGRKLLLILDTCEHLTDACARFATAVLRETGGITILATSRQPLHVPGEEVLRIGPLPVPDAAAGTGAVADAGDAVALFAQRAAAAVSGFTLAAADLPHVIDLCRRLDGIPLAIELAAVRVRALPVAELAARVEAGLSAVTGTRRGSTGRHQTLRATAEWSYQLCTDAERAAWRRLSVFAGTFDLATARDVIAGGDLPSARAAAVIGNLTDKSVVLPAGADRFRLLGSVREYGAARLADAGEDAVYRERHLARYLTLAEELSRRLIADGQQDRLGQLRAEYENIRTALEYGFTDARHEAKETTANARRARAAGRLAAALCPYWIMSSSVREGLRWQDRALQRFAAPTRERASALASRALLGSVIGVPEAVGQANEAVTVAASAGDERTHARAYRALQFAFAAAGRYAEALETADQARLLLEALGEVPALLTLDMQLAVTYLRAGNLEAVTGQCQRLLRGLSPGERWLRGSAHVLSALAYYQQPGQREACASAAGAGLRETLDVGNLIGDACSLEVFAWLAADAGRYQRAAWLLGAAQALWDRTGGRLSGSAAGAGSHDRSAATAA